MKIIIKRIKEYSDVTLSQVYCLDDEGFEVFKCYGLEPLIEGKERDKGYRIPVGKYGLLWHKSPRFKMTLPLLHNIDVPTNRYILIHIGNYAKDTIGCILVGERFVNEINGSCRITNSKKTINKLLKVLPQNLVDTIAKVENDIS